MKTSATAAKSGGDLLPSIHRYRVMQARRSSGSSVTYRSRRPPRIDIATPLLYWTFRASHTGLSIKTECWWSNPR